MRGSLLIATLTLASVGWACHTERPAERVGRPLGPTKSPAPDQAAAREEPVAAPAGADDAAAETEPAAAAAETEPAAAPAPAETEAAQEP